MVTVSHHLCNAVKLEALNVVKNGGGSIINLLEIPEIKTRKIENNKRRKGFNNKSGQRQSQTSFSSAFWFSDYDLI